MKLLTALLALCSVCAAADPLLGRVEVTGEKEAHVLFRTDSAPKDVPRIVVKDNVAELTFAGVALSEEGKKVDLASPHVLVGRVSVFEPEKGRVKARLILNGATEKLRDRIRLEKVPQGVLVSVAPPEGENATLALLKDEQAPLGGEVVGAVAPKAARGWGETLVPLVLLCFVGVGGAFGFRALKKKGRLGGSRKYLVEQVSYCGVGPAGKSGVSLVRVGAEFFLVGVGADQVTLISAMPKLADQWKDENKLERESFQEAVEQEVKRLKGSTPEYRA